MMEINLKEQLEKLNQIGIALSSETNLMRLLGLVVEESREFTGADAGSLYIRDGDVLCFEVAQNDTLARRSEAQADSFRPFPLPLTRTSIAGYVAVTGETLNVKDVYELEHDASVEYSFNRDFDKRNDYRSRSMLVVPMQDHRHENIGVLQLINALDDNGQVKPFPTDVEDLVRSLASQAAVAINNAKLISDIKNLFSALVKYSASAIDARSPHTAGHSMRVAALAGLLAKAVNKQRTGAYANMSLNEDELEELDYAAWLHDIGKIGVRENVLEKAGKLNPDRMHLISSRFERIGLSIKLDYKQKILDKYSNGAPEPSEIAALEQEMKIRLADIESDLALIHKINNPGWIDDGEMTSLERIASGTYLDDAGEPRPYLDDFEYENLSVRKGNLTNIEYQEIQSHVAHTENIVAKIPFTPELSRIPEFASAHHEMLNGSGYPKHLTGTEIPLQARILAVADIFDALVARDRPYKKAIPVDRALSILRDEASVGRLDPELVELFIMEKIGSEETVNSLFNENDHKAGQ